MSHQIVSREQWTAAREQRLIRGKALTRLREAIFLSPRGVLPRLARDDAG